MARFKPGQSGNPEGRPVGSRHKATIAAMDLLDGEAEGLTRKAVEVALSGDTTALRLCLERIAPPLKERPITGYDIPKIETVEDVLAALRDIGEKLSIGELLPSEAGALCAVLEQYRRHHETTDQEKRLKALEASK